MFFTLYDKWRPPYWPINFCLSSQQSPCITLLQQWSWIPLLHLMFPWLPYWCHHLWCGIKNTIEILVYSEEYVFPNLFCFQPTDVHFFIIISTKHYKYIMYYTDHFQSGTLQNHIFIALKAIGLTLQPF